MSPSPSTIGQRLHVVDALRGFAVVAIMLVHFLEHFIYDSYPVSTPLMASVNQGMKDAFFFLFAGKSYTIFALLFGFTYAIQYGNQLRKGKDFSCRFAWRLLILALFACLNAVFFPGGDVLLTFAIAGLILIPLRKLGIGTLAMVAVFFLLQPLELAYAAIQFFHPEWTPPTVLAANAYPSLKPCIDNGDFWGMAWNNLTTGQYSSFAWGIDAGRLMQAPGLFITGFILGKGGFFHTGRRNTVFWTRTLLASAAGSFVFYIAMIQPELGAPLKTAFTMWHNVSFSGIWVAGFVLLYRTAYFRQLTDSLRYYGKMSLTNYITQSVIGSLIFFPFALGLAPHLGYVASFAVGVAAMLLQIRFCRWWLGRHRYGPLEGIWHRLTWLHAPNK
ncbi:DUF418 domain-containing protein [Akkermansia glycaniphila]|uniref:DUF418 domain-containing protein n=1 Tax=Akkermansia glycaniphila TaxID=1679444 RepID=A0A1C7PF10_9BACT|nr:DUF418 domain-containing protein [Akkermansia glycaniphila]OCA04004.1 hypothetical protein AC781_01775 [Akkermansia glycaniphila]SEH72055.1 protein of unknown function (duf1624) [Akkermansia glycaniphila]